MTVATFVRYVDLMVVFTAILNIAKFAVLRDAASLKTIVGVASLALVALAIYLNFLAPMIIK